MEKDQKLQELDKALDAFDQNPLNLTNQDKNDEKQDPQFQAKMKAQYQKFMEQMKNIGQHSNPDDTLNNLAGLLGGLLKNVSDDIGQPQQDFKKSFQGFFSNLKDDNLQDAAQKLLGQFMDKSLLQEPLKQTKQHYQQFFEKQKGKISQQDLQRYKKQYNVIQKTLQVLNTKPDDKKTLISLFQQLQQYGKPPNGINSSMGTMFE